MFTEKASTAEADHSADTSGQYVLFEQAPLTGEWILQGAATKTLYSAWETLAAQSKGLPLLSAFDAGKYADYMQYAVVHGVKSKNPYEFEVGFVGDECAIVLGRCGRANIAAPTRDLAGALKHILVGQRHAMQRTEIATGF